MIAINNCQPLIPKTKFRNWYPSCNCMVISNFSARNSMFCKVFSYSMQSFMIPHMTFLPTNITPKLFCETRLFYESPDCPSKDPTATAKSWQRRGKFA